MWRRIFWRGLLLAGLFILAGCLDQGEPEVAPAPEPEPVEELQAEEIGTLAELMALVNESHAKVQKPRVNADSYIKGFEDNPFDFTPYMERREFVPEKMLSLEQVEGDLEVFFRILRGNYGLYYYLGGDEVFDAAQNNILVQMGALSAEERTGEKFAEILLENLSFVRDGHFRINDLPTNPLAFGVMYTGEEFQRYGDGYRNRSTGQVVDWVEGCENLSSLFRRAISPQGEIVHYPVRLVWGDEEPQPLRLGYEDGAEQTLHPSPWQSSYEESERGVDITWQGEIPVVFARNMGFDMAEKDPYSGKEFLQTAQAVEHAPVVMVDLRSNTGGNVVLPMKWLERYAGAAPTTTYVIFMYMTEELRLFLEDESNPTYIPFADMERYGDIQRVSDHYMMFLHQSRERVSNHRLLVLLTGKSTGSAAEAMVDAAYHVENTLIVGSNTYGTLVSNAFAWVYLPSSGVKVQFGSYLCVFPGDHFQEFVGLEPDLWVYGDAAELTAKMLERLG